MAEEVHKVVRQQLLDGGYQDGNMTDLIQVVIIDCAETRFPFIGSRGLFKLCILRFLKVGWIKNENMLWKF